MRNPDLLAGTALALQQAGDVVTTATDGAHALRAVKDQRPDVVVLNHNLPDIDGISICQQLKQDPALGEVVVIIVSGANLKSEEQGPVFESGADDYIVRPVGAREFLATTPVPHP